MKILLDIQNIKGSFSYKGPIWIKFKIGDSVVLYTETSNYNEGLYPFMEKHIVGVNQNVNRSYLEINVIAENGIILGQITVFFNKFKQFHSIEIKNQQEIYLLSYSLAEIAEDSEDIRLELKKTPSQHEEPQINLESGKVQILRLGVLMFNFCQRIDPLVLFYNKAVDIVTWKNPYKTIGLGVFLTVAIYYLKLVIFLGAVGLYFCKQLLLKQLSTIHRYRNVHKRLMVPKQNVYFLQYGMDQYNSFYENMCQFLFKDDKTLLINIIQMICKMSFFLIFLLFIFGVENLVVLTIWFVLILTSPFRNTILKKIKPVLQFAIGEYSKIIDRIKDGLSEVIGSTIKINQNQMVREFYFYHYQRWWVVKGWKDEIKKYSDQNYIAVVHFREKAPEGWGWIEQWKIDFNGEVDSEGFQYCNDLKTDFKSMPSLATRRRRKWKRACMKLREVF